jgi:hypothetical protein
VRCAHRSGAGWSHAGWADLASVVRIEVYSDTWDFAPQTIDLDGMSFEHPGTVCPVGGPVLQPLSIGGTVAGLTGSGLVLSTPGQPALALPAGANSFAFSNFVGQGTSYSVTVASQPPGQTCSVANGAGTVGTNSVTDIAVTCVAGGAVLGPLAWDAGNWDAAVWQ